MAQVAMDSEGFNQVISEKMGLTKEQVSRLAKEDVNVSSMEDFCYLTEEDLKDLFPEMTKSQMISFRKLKRKHLTDPEPPPATAVSPLPNVYYRRELEMVSSHEAAVTRSMSQMPMTRSHPMGPPVQVLHCTQRAQYQLPLKVKREEEEYNFIHFEVCLHDQDEAHAEKVILVVGAEGTGKKTLLDFFATVYCGYSEEEKRQILIPKPANIGDSAVMPITAYTFPKRKGSQFQYALTIVMVPRLGGEVQPVAGTSATEQLLEKLKGIFFHCIDKLHGIAYVIKASEQTLTPAQLGILESMRNIFGDSVYRNLFIANTFAYNGEPNATKALHAAGIQFQVAYKFNCSPLVLPNQGEEDAAFERLNWQMSEASMMRLLQCIADIPSVNL